MEYLDIVMEILLLGLVESLFDEELLGIHFARFFKKYTYLLLGLSSLLTS